MYLLDRNRDSDIENGRVDTAGEGESGTDWGRMDAGTQQGKERVGRTGGVGVKYIHSHV